MEIVLRYKENDHVFFLPKSIILIVYATLLISIIIIFQFSVLNAYHQESFPNS